MPEDKSKSEKISDLKDSKSGKSNISDDSSENGETGEETKENEGEKKEKIKLSPKERLLKTKDFITQKSIYLYHFVLKNFRPTLWVSITCGILLTITFILAVWQLYCFDSKNILITKIETNIAKAEEVIPPASMIGNKNDYDYRRVNATGEMMFLNSMKLLPRKYNKKNGYHIITPLKTDDGTVVLVDRGFVPEGQNPGNTYWQTSNITIKGIARVPDDKGLFTAENNPKRNEWYYIDFAQMAKNVGVMELYPLIIEQERTSPLDTEYPIGGQTVTTISNYHHNIAVVLFVIDISLFFAWIFYSFQNGIRINTPSEDEKKESTDDSEDDEEMSSKKKRTDDDDKEDDTTAQKPKSNQTISSKVSKDSKESQPEAGNKASTTAQSKTTTSAPIKK